MRSGATTTVSGTLLFLGPLLNVETESDVVYLSFPGREFVVLGSVESAIELLDKRSQIYSDRVRSAILEL